jgi:hypothetical protein
VKHCGITEGLAQGNQQTDNGSEQGHGLDEGGDDQHSSLDTASSLRLTGNPFHSRTTDAANTQTSTNSSQTSTNSGTHNTYVTSNFQQD